MTLIEGIGDELTITITLLVLFVTLIAAWASTRVTESRLTLTQSQLNGLRVELNELTVDDQSDEEIGSSTESTDAEHHLLDEPPPLEPVPESELGAEGIRVIEVGAGNRDEFISRENVKKAIEESKRLESAASSSTEQPASADGDISGSQDKDRGNINAVKDKDRENISSTQSERTNLDEESVNDQSQRTNVDETDHSTSAAGSISLKIKFLNETERMVRTRIEETVGNFKRLNFAEESRDGRVVHLIFNGQFLRDDSRQLGSYSIVDNCVLHCHISQQQQSPGTAQEPLEQGDIDLGQFMVPLFACTIGFVWYLRWQYSYMFNTMSTMSLSAVTVLFMLAVLAAWRG